MLIEGKQKIISKSLSVSDAMVSQTIRGVRGKRGSDLQDRILKASYKADEIFEKAEAELVRYCNELRSPLAHEGKSPLTPEGQKSPLTPEGGTAGASYIRVMKKCVN